MFELCEVAFDSICTFELEFADCWLADDFVLVIAGGIVLQGLFLIQTMRWIATKKRLFEYGSEWNNRSKSFLGVFEGGSISVEVMFGITVWLIVVIVACGAVDGGGVVGGIVDFGVVECVDAFPIKKLSTGFNSSKILSGIGATCGAVVFIADCDVTICVTELVTSGVILVISGVTFGEFNCWFNIDTCDVSERDFELSTTLESSKS